MSEWFGKNVLKRRKNVFVKKQFSFVKMSLEMMFNKVENDGIIHVVKSY